MTIKIFWHKAKHLKKKRGFVRTLNKQNNSSNDFIEI